MRIQMQACIQARTHLLSRPEAQLSLSYFSLVIICAVVVLEKQGLGTTNPSLKWITQQGREIFDLSLLSIPNQSRLTDHLADEWRMVRNVRCIVTAVPEKQFLAAIWYLRGRICNRQILCTRKCNIQWCFFVYYCSRPPLCAVFQVSVQQGIIFLVMLCRLLLLWTGLASIIKRSCR